MWHQEIESPAELQHTIKCFWYTCVDFGETMPIFEILPDGNTEIIFLFGKACSLSTPDGLLLLSSPFIMGLLNQPAILYAQSRVEVIGIRCFPWTVFDLLGLKPSQEIVRAIKHPVARLQPILQQLVEAGKINEALNEVKQYQWNAKTNIPATDSLVLKAGASMLKANGTIPVSQVAAAAHATIRTLERNFKQSSGHTVKDVSGVMRFEQVRNHLFLNPDAELAALAQALGYADQAHLSREFKRYTGITPAAFARKIKARKQSGNFVVFVQA
jgi:AraC-like DNA-binding protein